MNDEQIYEVSKQIVTKVMDTVDDILDGQKIEDYPLHELARSLGVTMGQYLGSEVMSTDGKGEHEFIQLIENTMTHNFIMVYRHATGTDKCDCCGEKMDPKNDHNWVVKDKNEDLK